SGLFNSGQCKELKSFISQCKKVLKQTFVSKPDSSEHPDFHRDKANGGAAEPMKCSPFISKKNRLIY
ncbi:hypothetical protein, partial [Pedobacter zeae]|uniref:hypothetical protein n=1 Tax=Pedobacter zeae TaxID=1737356 RepID=UPI001E429D77